MQSIKRTYHKAKETAKLKNETATNWEKALPILNCIFFVGVVVVNALGTAGAFGSGLPTGVISDNLPTLVTPAGWAFSISWALIYCATAVMLIYQVLPNKRGNSIIVDRISVVYMINSCFNMAWIICWAFLAYWASVAVMLCILVTNIVMYTRIGVNYGIHSRGSKRYLEKEGRQINTFEYWMFQIWISLYLAWICAATVVNISAAIVSTADPPSSYVAVVWSNEGWAAFFISAIAIITLIHLYWRSDFIFGACASWTTLAIGLNYDGVNLVSSTTGYVVSALLAVSTLQTLAKVIYRRFIRHKLKRNSKEGEDSDAPFVVATSSQSDDLSQNWAQTETVVDPSKDPAILV